MPPLRRTLATLLLPLALLLTTPPTTPAQPCGEGWLPPGEGPGIKFDVSAGDVRGYVEWDPDGPGPRHPMLVFFGRFDHAGTTPSSCVAGWDLAAQRWVAFGTEAFNGPVHTAVVLHDGQLVIGGLFTQIGNRPVSRLALWSGDRWEQFAGGVNPTPAVPSGGYVGTLQVLPGNRLLVGGEFSITGVQASDHLAVWEGDRWTTLGSGVNRSVGASALLPNGDIIVAGRFTHAGGTVVNGLARWNGTQWSSVGDASRRQQIIFSMNNWRALHVESSGTVLVGTSFWLDDTSPGCFTGRWDPATNVLTPLGRFNSAIVTRFTSLPDGTLVAAGFFLPWSSSGSGRASLAVAWDGSEWRALRNQFSSSALMTAIGPHPDGGLIGVGGFGVSGGAPADGVIRWDGQRWGPLFPDTTGPQGSVSSILPLRNADVALSGSFSRIDGLAAPSLARRNATTGRWSAGPAGYAASLLAESPDGSILLGFNNSSGQSTVAQWRDSSLRTLGDPFNGPIRALAVLPSGDPLVAGDFTIPGDQPIRGIARWAGGQWASLGDFTYAPHPFRPSINAVEVQPNGNLLVAGRFDAIGGVQARNLARWTGANWSPLGPGSTFSDPFNGISTFTTLPSGGTVVGGLFASSTAPILQNIALLNGNTWSPLGAGLTAPTSPGSAAARVNATVVAPNGDIIAGGSFSLSGTTPLSNIARFSGAEWRPLSAGLPAPVNTLALMPSGELWAGLGSTSGPAPVPSLARYTFTGAPVVLAQPARAAARIGQTVMLSATPAQGYSGVRVQWLRNNLPIADGPGGASPGGGTVRNAAAVLLSPTNASPATLIIDNLQPSDAGSYSARFFNPCGEVITAAAELFVSPCTPADIAATDGTPGPDGLIDAGDFSAFFSAFFTAICEDCGAPWATQCTPADIATSDGTPAPSRPGDGCINNGDFQLFFTGFFAGCP